MIYKFKYFALFLIIIINNGNSAGDSLKSISNKKLVLINSYTISVPEPSGLVMSKDNGSLYTVSDYTGAVYNISLAGNVIDSIQLTGNLDLEGVCFTKTGDSLWLVNERDREILKIDLNGNIILRKKILNGDDNKGLEGICINPITGNIFILKEKYPGMLIELDEDLNVINQNEMNFADDFSGMTWDKNNNQLIIISHLSKKIFFYNIGEGVTESFDINVVQAEGIAIDNNSKIYIVSDSDSKLYVYEFPQSLK